MWMLLLFPAFAGELGLSNALQIALEHNPDLVLAELALEQAGAQRIDAQSAFDPVLSASAIVSDSSYLGSIGIHGSLSTGTTWEISTALTRLETSDTRYESINLELSQDLLVWLRPTLAHSLVLGTQEQLDLTSLETLALRNELFTDVISAWWEWQTALLLVEVAQSEVTLTLSLEERTKALLSVGEVEPMELTRVQAERLLAEQSLLAQEEEAENAADMLLLLLGVDPGEPIVPGQSPTQLSWLDLSRDEHLALARANSPALARARVALMAAERQAREQSWAGLPDLNGVGSVGWEDGNAAWSTGIELSIPLGGRAARAARDEAALALLQAQQNLETTDRELVFQIDSGLRAIVSAQKQLALAEAQLGVARLTELGERARLEAGTRRMDALLEAQQARKSAEITRLNAQLSMYKAMLDVAKWEGRIDRVLK